MDCGIKISEFWSLSVLEIEDYIESYNRAKERQVKEQILWQHAVVDLLDERLVARLCDPKIEFTTPWDRYPDLFEEEKNLNERLKIERQVQRVADSRRKYAVEFNRRRSFLYTINRSRS